MLLASGSQIHSLATGDSSENVNLELNVIIALIIMINYEINDNA